MEASIALANAKSNKNRAIMKFFKEMDEVADLDISPKFTFDKDSSFFTIGSCFARNVENYLMQHGVPLLSKMDNLPPDYFKAEGGKARAGYQNVYTPGSVLEMSRLLTRDDKFHSIVEVKGNHFDLLTHGLKGLPLDTTRSVRDILLSTYENLLKTDVLIITLGYNEAWYFKQDDAWVNQSPADQSLRRIADEFELHILNESEIYELLVEAIDNFKSINPDIKFVITVSPVPLNSTFSNDHIVVANQRSKSSLHSAAQRLRSEFDYIDYFPSYEMVTLSDKKFAFLEDQVHVSYPMISAVMKRFFGAYLAK